MTSAIADLYLPLLYRALDEEIGLRVATNKPQELRSHLTAVRRAEANPRLKELKFFLPPGNKTVFIAKKSVELEA